MSCCGPAIPYVDVTDTARDDALAGELKLASRPLEGDLRQTDISVPSMHCGSCIVAVEGTLGALPGVQNARVNLTARRVAVRWTGEVPPPLIQTLEHAGYPAFLFDAENAAPDPVRSELLRALAVAGFSAMNIMLMSVSVWAGATPAERYLFHWISALLALPALVYSGRIFFVSGWNALRHGRTNMDVPVSIGVLLAFGMSLYDTITHGPHAYFDAAVSLLFFLLIGRTLDHLMRERARTAVNGLARLVPRVALRADPDGSTTYLPISELRPGERLRILAGDRIPVDCVVEAGRSDIDQSLVNGESIPRPAALGTRLTAGTLNLTAPLMVRVTAAERDSFLAEMIRLMEAAEGGRSTYRRLADRAARLYAPAVHSVASLSFLGWLLLAGDLHQAMTIAIAVLIITCPCALGLAVPMVQVMAARRLFEAGIMMKDGSALERLAEVDTVVFDKTGTLTTGRPRLVNANELSSEILSIAGALGTHSRHPYSRALAAAGGSDAFAFDEVKEVAGLGIEARLDGHIYRLGHGSWTARGDATGVTLARDGCLLARFRFEDDERPQAGAAIADIASMGLGVEILSGDVQEQVGAFARRFGVDNWQANVRPADKFRHIAGLRRQGRHVLMVGDGLNDAPALEAADVSMAPADGAEIGRNAADFVFLRKGLEAVPTALSVARSSARLIRQNFALSVAYNALALPLAISGQVTPLIAALAMSLSSITVIANSMRLSAPRGKSPAPQAQPAKVALT